MLFITHNLGVVAEIADRVAVMYAAGCSRRAPVRDVFRTPRHPYTRGLLASTARPGTRRSLASWPPSRHGPGRRRPPAGLPVRPALRAAPRRPVCAASPVFEELAPGRTRAAAAGASMTALLSVSRAGKRFGGGRTLFGYRTPSARWTACRSRSRRAGRGPGGRERVAARPPLGRTVMRLAAPPPAGS